MNRDADRGILLALLRAEQVAAPAPEQWHRLARLARLHRVEEMLYRQLKAMGMTEQIPADVLQSLRSAYLRTTGRNVRIYHELKAMFDRFRKAGVQAIPLKGAYLADAVYHDMGARAMGDVDLLVRKADLALVHEAMLEMGYSITDRLRETVPEMYHFCYLHSGHGLSVEIHWDLIVPTFGIRVDVDGLWERSRATQVEGIPVREMSPGDQVLGLCVHASMDVFENGLRGMCDLAETIRHHGQGLVWTTVADRSLQWGTQRCVYVNLRLALELLNAPVPEEVLEGLKPADFEPSYLSIAREYLFASAEEPGWALPGAAGAVEVWEADGRGRKFDLLCRKLFRSRQYMAMRYPAAADSWRILLYYPVYIKEAVSQQGPVVWNLFRGDRGVRLRAERQARVNSLKDWLLSR